MLSRHYVLLTKATVCRWSEGGLTPHPGLTTKNMSSDRNYTVLVTALDVLAIFIFLRFLFLYISTPGQLHTLTSDENCDSSFYTMNAYFLKCCYT